MTNINFELNPALPYLNVEATKGFFYLQYPSGWSYWEIQDADGQQLKNGNYTFPQEVLAQWLDSDQVLIDDILAAAPWAIKPVPPAPEPDPEPIPEPEVIEDVVEDATEPVSDDATEPVSEEDAVDPESEVSE